VKSKDLTFSSNLESQDASTILFSKIQDSGYIMSVNQKDAYQINKNLHQREVQHGLIKPQ
jgi:hypothetical protein